MIINWSKFIYIRIVENDNDNDIWIVEIQSF